MFSSTLTMTFLLSLLDQQQTGILYYEPIFDASSKEEVPLDFEILYCNQKAATSIGLTVQQLIGCQALSFPNLDAAARKTLFVQLLSVYQNKEPLETFLVNSISNRYFQVNRSSIGPGVLAEVKDVTQEVQERAEKEHQTQFATQILETALNGWFTCKAVRDDQGIITDFIITRVNRQYTHIVGLPEKEVTGKRYLELFPKAKDNGVFDLNCRVVSSGISEQHQMHYDGDGLNAWYDVVVTKMEPDGVLVNFADITPYKQTVSELTRKNTLLDNILKHSSNGISVTNIIRDKEGKVIDGRTILANDAAVAYTGLPKELYLSKTAVELEPNIVQSPYFKMCVHTLDTGVPSLAQYQMESTGRWLEISVSRMDYDHIITIFTDITTTKEAQLAQERLLEQLKRSNKNLEDFAYAASHDLKEPIRKIRTFTSKVKNNLATQITEEDSRLFDRIETAAVRMQLLVDDLLEFSQLSGESKQFEEINLTNKIQKVLTDLELQIEEKEAIIIVDTLPTVRGNRRQLQQLFQNLIGNALKYSKEGVVPEVRITSQNIKGATVPFSLPSSERDKDFYLIEVQDNGIGFEQQYAEKIFEMFQRLHGKLEYSGTGVGLAIARRVVENHKGFLFATAEPGRGATFHILLPVTQ